ncbi:MAG TPA: MaoC family dehydratase [Pyrinomonadaceae bacterium]|nr:MaoC family dehydratase [Pyrinomonadaceae bacterium]
MNLKVGDTASITREITDKDISAFAELTGDHNPVHLDEAFAQKTRFGRRIAHGMLGASLISTALGTRLPGLGSIYLSQTLQFLGPVYIGDTLTVRITVKKVNEKKSIVTLDTACENQRGETVIRGEAVVLVEKSQIGPGK